VGISLTHATINISTSSATINTSSTSSTGSNTTSSTGSNTTSTIRHLVLLHEEEELVPGLGDGQPGPVRLQPLPRVRVVHEASLTEGLYVGPVLVECLPRLLVPRLQEADPPPARHPRLWNIICY
jgi:hypothetical protein